MLSTDRPEFESILGAMFGAWNRILSGNTVEGYWKGCIHMPLADFVRCCNKAVQGYTEDSNKRLPDVGALWAMKRGLRTVPVVNRDIEAQWRGDHWDSKANSHLLAYIQQKPKRYSDGDPQSDYTRTHTAPLVAAKNRWAAIMREAGRVDKPDQQEVWANCMADAEQAIDHPQGR